MMNRKVKSSTMKRQLRNLMLATVMMGAAFGMAYTSAPCESTYPACDLTKIGSICSDTEEVISFGDPFPFGWYYCGGNKSGRCGGPNAPGVCSELLFRGGTARQVYCGSTPLGYCFTSLDAVYVPTGYDCGLQPCPDVPPSERIQPNIIGYPAPAPWVTWDPFPLPSNDGPGF